MEKKGIQFELFVKAIYEEILLLEGHETINVQHDQKIRGKSGQFHQIDIYWELKIAGIVHRVAIECKEYKNTVSVGKIRDFFGALEDIGNIHGIFVTTKGYQSGAKIYAQHKNISLKLTKTPTEENILKFQGIREIYLQQDMYSIQNGHAEIRLDIEWILKNTDIKEGDKVSINLIENEFKIIDKKGKKIGVLQDFYSKLPREPCNTKALIHEYKFDDAYIEVTDKYPRLKIHGLRFTYDTFRSTSNSKISYKLMAKSILEDIITGDVHFFKKTIKSSIVHIN